MHFSSLIIYDLLIFESRDKADKIWEHGEDRREIDVTFKISNLKGRNRNGDG